MPPNLRVTTRRANVSRAPANALATDLIRAAESSNNMLRTALDRHETLRVAAVAAVDALTVRCMADGCKRIALWWGGYDMGRACDEHRDHIMVEETYAPALRAFLAVTQ